MPFRFLENVFVLELELGFNVRVRVRVRVMLFLIAIKKFVSLSKFFVDANIAVTKNSVTSERPVQFCTIKLCKKADRVIRALVSKISNTLITPIMTSIL